MVRTVDLPDLGAVHPGASFVSDYAGSGRFTAPSLLTYVNAGITTMPSATITATGGTTSRTLSARALDMGCNVKDFGAVGNGVADDTAALQAVLSSGVHAAYLPPGTYKVTAPLTLSATEAGFKLYGAGQRVSVIAPSSTTANVFNITSANGQTPIEMSDLSVEYYVTAAAGTIFNLAGGCGGANIHDIMTIGGWNVMTLGGGALSQAFILEKLTFTAFLNNGLTVDVYPGGLGYVSKVFMSCSITNPVGTGLYVISGQSMIFDTMQIQGMEVPILFRTRAGAIITDMVATNVYADNVARGSAGGGGWTLDGSTAPLRRFQLTNCWAGACGGAGFLLVAADQISLVNCMGVACGLEGFAVAAGCSNIIIEGCQAVGNSQILSGAHSGITVAPVCTNVTLLGNRCGPSVDFPVSLQQYGILIAAGATNEYIIAYNRLAGNVAGGLLDGGTGLSKVVGNNLLT